MNKFEINIMINFFAKHCLSIVTDAIKQIFLKNKSKIFENYFLIKKIDYNF